MRTLIMLIAIILALIAGAFVKDSVFPELNQETDAAKFERTLEMLDALKPADNEQGYLWMRLMHNYRIYRGIESQRGMHGTLSPELEQKRSEVLETMQHLMDVLEGKEAC